MNIWTITISGNILFWFREICVTSDMMLFTITCYVGENLKWDFALLNSVCVLVCKILLYTEGKTKLSGIKIWTITFSGNILFLFCDNCATSDMMLFTTG